MKIKLFNISILIFMIVMVINSYASTDPTINSSNTGATGLKKLHYNEIYFYVSKRNVKFTQDDSYYYFDISQDLVHYYSPSSTLIYNTTNSVVYLSTTNNITQLYIEQQSSNGNFLIQKISENDGNDYFTSYRINNSGTVIENYCYHSFSFPSNTWWRHSGGGTELIYNNVSGSATTGSVITSNFKIKVEKSKINQYRYCGLLFNNVYATKVTLTSGGISVNGSSTKCGTTSTIDLLEYINCEHEWELTEYDSKNHVLVCKNCEWVKNEEHVFDITYDNIENDRCICGINKNVNITISDNIHNELNKKLSTPSELMSSYEKNKIGYDFLYIEDTEILHNEGIVISTISELPMIVPKNSHSYKYIYNPHKYYLNFNKENNLGLDLDSTINANMTKQEMLYGKEYNINKSLYKLNGYNFVGWSVLPDLDKVMFSDEAKIINLTDEDNKIINLYPVYSAFNFKVRYLSTRTDCVPNIIDKIYNYGVNQKLEEYNGYLYDNMSFTGWKYGNDIIKNNNTEELQRFIYKDNMTLNLYATFNFSLDHNERSKEKTNDPSKKKVNIDQNDSIITIDELPTSTETKEIINNNIIYIDKPKQKNDKKKDKGEEETIEEEILDGIIAPINVYVKRDMNNTKLVAEKKVLLSDRIRDFFTTNNIFILFYVGFRLFIKYVILGLFILLLLVILMYYIYKTYYKNDEDNEKQLMLINE